MPNNSYTISLQQNILNFLKKIIYKLERQRINTHSTKIESTYFIVTAEDAQNELPNIFDLRFLVSLISQAFHSSRFNLKSEERQFLADLPRLSLLKENNVEISKDNGSELLTRWSKEIAASTKLPEDKIRAVISTLNQGASYGAATEIMQLGAVRNEQQLMLTTMHSSLLFSNRLSRNKNTVTYESSLPLQTHVCEDGIPIESGVVKETPDVVVTTKITVDLNNFKTVSDANDTDAKLDSNSVTLSTVVDTLDPDIKLRFNQNEQYQDCIVDEFLLLADVTPSAEHQEWVLTPRF